MILTRSELAKMTELFDAQELPDTFPDDLEFSSQIMEPIPLTGPDPETGEDLFVTGFYFEPVAPNIPDRIY